MTLNVLDDAISWAKSHPQRFFAEGKPNEFDQLEWPGWTPFCLALRKF
jgi:hypothetical protein